MPQDHLRPSVVPAASRRAVASAVLALGALASAGAQAAVTFQFNFIDPTNTSYNNATLGQGFKDAVNNSATLFSAMFATRFDYTATILLDATATNDPAGLGLASAGSAATLAGNATAGFNVGEVVRLKIQSNGAIDANEAAADGSVNVNFGQPWQLDAGALVTNTQFDFYSTMFHEYTHALGFASLIAQNGSGPFGGDENWGAFDKFLTDVNGATVIDSTTFKTNALWTSASVGGTSPGAGLFFNGANAVAAAGGLVGLYSPTTWAGGSSGSHLDTNNSAYAGMMMNHATTEGPGARLYSEIEVGILKDIGYTNLAPIPEPSTYALMLVGLGLVGGLARRRRA